MKFSSFKTEIRARKVSFFVHFLLFVSLEIRDNLELSETL